MELIPVLLVQRLTSTTRPLCAVKATWLPVVPHAGDTVVYDLGERSINPHLVDFVQFTAGRHEIRIVLKDWTQGYDHYDRLMARAEKLSQHGWDVGT